MPFKNMFGFMKKGKAADVPREVVVDVAVRVEVTRARVGNAGTVALGAEEMLKEGLEAQGPVHVRIMFDENGEVASCGMEHLEIAQAAPTSLSCATTLVGSPQLTSFANAATDMAAEGKTTAPSTPCATVISRMTTTKAPKAATLVDGKRVLTVDDFRIIHVLGEGGQGLVLLVQDQVTDGLFALKVISKGSFKYLDHVSRVFVEQDAMRAVAGNPSFVGIKGTFEDEDNFLILMEYYPCGDLHSKIQAEGRLPTWMARRYAAQVILAMEDLHRKRIIHRDIKPKNILISDLDEAVISDFGIARMFGRTAEEQPWRKMEECWELKEDLPPTEEDLRKAAEGRPDTTVAECGTFQYLAPEMPYREYSYEVDVWAFAVTLFEMLHGRRPFGYDDGLTKWTARINAVFAIIKIDDDIDPGAADLLRTIFHKDEMLRPSWADIKEHQFFDPINWDEVACRKPMPFKKAPKDLRPESLVQFVHLGRPYAQEQTLVITRFLSYVDRSTI
ncbi:hypothetical protein BN946_scf184937.g17 [Trametes cinnabarina]|uniref:non-specific serine/threonine protein kinase n=1 Tax=Pycnoporus cinnabarinus TaxID=5643 RepID=A0A060SVB5_PYCCI|nr:hypothetical protein BN946_scf184937.g17 [Trametes cinnabarina]